MTGDGKKFTIRWHCRLLVDVGRSWEANPGTPHDLSSRKRKNGMLLVEKSRQSETKLSGESDAIVT